MLGQLLYTLDTFKGEIIPLFLNPSLSWLLPWGVLLFELSSFRCIKILCKNIWCPGKLHYQSRITLQPCKWAEICEIDSEPIWHSAMRWSNGNQMWRRKLPENYTILSLAFSKENSIRLETLFPWRHLAVGEKVPEQIGPIEGSRIVLIQPNKWPPKEKDLRWKQDPRALFYHCGKVQPRKTWGPI